MAAGLSAGKATPEGSLLPSGVMLRMSGEKDQPLTAPATMPWMICLLKMK